MAPAADNEASEAADRAAPVRVLLLARHPLRAEDLGLEDRVEIELFGPVRRLTDVEQTVEEAGPDVVFADTSFPEGQAISAIREIVESAPDVRVLALTPDPPPREHVARAIEAGASGFIDVNAEPDEFVAAIRTVHSGELWLPAEQTEAILSDAVEDLNVTRADRRSRLTALVVGLIPLAGILAAFLALVWRKYLGEIGVRPIDLAIDPGTRVIDAVTSILMAVGVFGPFLFIGTWLDMLRTATEGRPGFAWLTTRPKLAWALLALVVLALVAFLSVRFDVILVLFIGPAVLLALLAVVLDATSELPRFLRLSLPPRRLIAAGIVLAAALLAVLSVEATVRGPAFGPRGSEGFLVDRVIGFSAHPVRVINVDGQRPPRDALYLGGNADLYVLVDPCKDDDIEMVSVGAHRLEVIDEVTCPPEDGTT